MDTVSSGVGAVQAQMSAFGMGTSQLRPLAGFPQSPYFARDLKFFTSRDCSGRLRLTSYTVETSNQLEVD